MGSLRIVRLAPILLLATFSMTVCFLVACGALNEGDSEATDDELCASSYGYGYGYGKCQGYDGYYH